MRTCVICPRGVNIGNQLLTEAKMKGCQVRDWIAGERDVIFTNFIYDVSMFNHHQYYTNT